MNADIQRYLTESTTGLAGDRELQLDIQAELQSHLDERIDGLLQDGRSQEEAADEALRAMGELTELAPALLDGNARRLSTRARLRQALRVALPVAALLTLFFCSDLLPLSAIDNLNMLNGNGGGSWPPDTANLSEHERLILHGDPDRPSHEQQRAIWEAEPDNPVYYGNYIMQLAGYYEELAPTPEGRLAFFRREIARAESLDPDNAIYGLMLAARILDQAVEIDARGHGDKATVSMTVKDETQLEAGLAELQRSLALPGLGRRQIDILSERMRILGQPTRMVEQIQIIAMSASIRLPEVMDFRNLARISGLAGERVAEREGLAAAQPLLDIGERLARRLNDHGFCLIDALVVGAILEDCGRRAERVHAKHGDASAAAAIRARTERLIAPKTRWDARRKGETPEQREGEKTMHFAGSILTQMLMPAIGEYPAPEAYREGRLLDYTVAEQVAASILMLIGFVLVIGCALVALRRRFGARGDAIPILLLPTGRFTLRVLAIAIGLPLLLQAIYVRLPGVGARDYAVSLVPVRFGMELTLVGGAIVVLITLLIRDFVRRRCCELRIEAPAPAPAWHRKALIGMALVGAGSLMVPVPYLPHAAGGPAKVAMALLLLGLLLAACVAFWRGMFGDAKLGLYYGSFARSALPFFCAAIIIIGALARPLLLQREARLLANDTLMPTQTDGPGLSSTIEQNLAERLRDEFAAALSAERNP
ncbi:MAG: hypothetical protein ACI8W8_003083 [Rhodothermales bacterium]|jgi:hypothetical protein